MIRTVTRQEFAVEVVESPMPVLVDFFTDHCSPCKRLAPILEELAEENTDAVKIVKVNAAEEPTLAGSYRISGVPALLLFCKGRVAAQIVGLRGKKDLQKWLTENLVTAR